MASCHVGHTGTHLITKVMQCWARIVLRGVTRVNKQGTVEVVPTFCGLGPCRTWNTAEQRLQ
jgi:hypothetical protein